MPVLTNPRWELFAQELAKGKAASDAYKTAGFRPNRHNACVLKQKQTIIDRVSELLTERDRQHAKATEKAVEKLRKDITTRVEQMTDAELEASIARFLVERDGAIAESW